MKRFFSSPVAIVIILLFVTSVMDSQYANFGQWFINKMMILPGVIIALAFHEYGHALLAVKCGDPTPKNQGRLTINPLAHVDPIGLACLFFVGFGWGVPVQINPRNFKNPRRDELLVAIAGVAMNFVLAVIFMGLIKLFVVLAPPVAYSSLGSVIIEIFQDVVVINLVLLVFNLIPIPPLDGFNVLTQIFNLRNTKIYYTLYNNGFWILLALIVFNVTDMILSPLVNMLYTLIVGIYF